MLRFSTTLSSICEAIHTWRDLESNRSASSDELMELIKDMQRPQISALPISVGDLAESGWLFTPVKRYHGEIYREWFLDSVLCPKIWKSLVTSSLGICDGGLRDWRKIFPRINKPLWGMLKIDWMRRLPWGIEKMVIEERQIVCSYEEGRCSISFLALFIFLIPFIKLAILRSAFGQYLEQFITSTFHLQQRNHGLSHQLPPPSSGNS